MHNERMWFPCTLSEEKDNADETLFPSPLPGNNRISCQPDHSSASAFDVTSGSYGGSSLASPRGVVMAQLVWGPNGLKPSI